MPDYLVWECNSLSFRVDQVDAGIWDWIKELLTDRKTRLEKTILALEKEQAGLVAYLEAGELTESQIKTLKDFVARVAEGIDVGDADLETRRGVIETLDVQARLTVEDGKKVVRTRCMLGEKVYNLRPAAFVVYSYQQVFSPARVATWCALEVP